MQYILNEKEYKSLMAKAAKVDRSERLITQTDLQKLCTMVANHVPVDAGWRQEEPAPWGCMLTQRHWVCDECPCIDLCPCKSKRWSK